MRENKLINDVLLEYERSRLIADEEARKRLNEVYERIPRIKQIDTELSSMGIEVAMTVLKSDANVDTLIEKLHQKSIDLKMEKGELLIQNNFPLDYIKPKYNCNICQDTGYVDSQRCQCFKQKIIDRYYNQSNLKNILDKENFDTFIFDYYSDHKFNNESFTPRKNIERIYAACVDFVSNFDNTSDNLFFVGSSGLGKTFLSNCIAKDLLNKGKLVVYQTASNLIDILKQAKFDESNELIIDKANDIFECDLLIIDDLGTEYITDYSQTELFNVINRRLISQKKMIISTNLSPENFKDTYPERIISRVLGNFTSYKFYGEDIRVKIAEQKRKKNNKKA